MASWGPLRSVPFPNRTGIQLVLLMLETLHDPVRIVVGIMLYREI